VLGSVTSCKVGNPPSKGLRHDYGIETTRMTRCSLSITVCWRLACVRVGEERPGVLEMKCSQITLTRKLAREFLPPHDNVSCSTILPREKPNYPKN
jgi:hypothetical protein